MGDDDGLVYAFACHLVAVQALNASVQTIKLYDGRHKQFLTYLQTMGYGPPFTLDLLNATNIRGAALWVRERSRGIRGGEHAARALISTLKTTSAWLADEGYIPVDLVSRVRRPRAHTGARMPFTREDVWKLVAATGACRTARRDIAIIHLLLDTGMRVGGLCSIRLGDVDMRERRLLLRLKGGRQHTLYFGSPDRRDGGRTVRALRAWCSDRAEIANRWPTRHAGMLFLGFDGWPFGEAGVREMFKKLELESGVQHVIPHRFRHTYATFYLVRHPGDETGLRGTLGHLSDDMYREYIHIAHEIIEERAGRVALSEAWLNEAP